MMKDDEWKGSGNSYTTLWRQYDPRLGRWKSIDPVILPYQSPYVNNNNNPIVYMDPDGDFGFIGAAIGAVVGAVTEVVSQTIANGMSNLANGKGFFNGWSKNMDWGDVAIAAGEGALIGSGVGLVGAIAIKAGGALARSALDWKGNGEGLQVAGFNKDGTNFRKDLVGNAIGFAFGGFGIPGKNLGDVISKGIVGGSKNVLTKLGGGLVGGIADGLWGGYIGGAYNLAYQGYFGTDGGNTSPVIDAPTAGEIEMNSGSRGSGNVHGNSESSGQAGAFKKESGAQSRVEQLKKGGVNAWYIKEGGMYKVKIDKSDIEKARVIVP